MERLRHIIGEITYDYPFLFVFLLFLGTCLIKASYGAIGALFLLLWLFSLFRLRLFIFSLISLAVLLVIHHRHPKPAPPQNRPLAACVMDTKTGKRLTLELSSRYGKIYLFASKLYDNIYPFDRIEIKGRFRGIKCMVDSPFKRYLMANGFTVIGFASYIKKLSACYPMAYFENIRRWLENEFYYFLGSKEFAFIENAVFGDARNRKEIRSAFVKTQLAHLLSVSGLHMSFVFGIFWFVFYQLFAATGKIRRRFNIKNLSTTIAIPFVLAYFLISGMHIPAIRSFLMMLAFIAGLIGGYRRNSYNVLFAAAVIVILIFGENIIFSASFVLSFFLSFCAIFIYRFIKPFNTPPAISYALFSILICLFAMPIGAYYFHRISPVSFVGNLIVVPFFGFVVMPLSFAAMISAPVPWHVKAYLFKLLNAATATMLKFVFVLSTFPVISIKTGVGTTVLLYLAMFGTVWLIGRKLSPRPGNQPQSAVKTNP